MTYTLLANSACIRRDADNADIPPDPGNPSWQAFQDWIAAGNTPIPIPVKPVDMPTYVSNARYARETGGVTVSGQPILTDRDSQNLISGLVTLLNNDASIASINFKGPTGYVAMPRATVMAIARAVGLYVQSCRTAEAVIDADVASGAITSMSDIDASPHWPSNVL